MQKIITLFLALFAGTNSFTASLALVKVSSFEYHLIGGVTSGVQDIKLEMNRPSQVFTGENFIVVTSSFETRLLANDGTKLHDKEIGNGRTNWVHIGENFVLVKFRNGTFCYSINEDLELVAAEVSPNSYGSPSRIIIFDSMVMHEWGSSGAYTTYLEEGILKTKKIHNYRLQQGWYLPEPTNREDQRQKEVSVKMSSHDELHEIKEGKAVFPLTESQE